MILAHKIALDPNDVQATSFRKAAGTARFAYNWALSEWQRQYDAWKADSAANKPSDAALRRQLNFGEFRRQLAYKAAHRGKTVIVVSCWYPSSKICSIFRHKLSTMPLDVRAWT